MLNHWLLHLKKDLAPKLIAHYSHPKHWDDARRLAHNQAAYLRYIRVLHQLAKLYQLRFALFVQPVPGHQKPLTPEEKAVVGDLSYTDKYLKMTERILSLNQEGILTVSLLDAFKDRAYSIYSDPIHFQDSTKEDPPPGNLILSLQIARHLEKHWGLKRIANPTGTCP